MWKVKRHQAQPPVKGKLFLTFNKVTYILLPITRCPGGRVPAGARWCSRTIARNIKVNPLLQDELWKARPGQPVRKRQLENKCHWWLAVWTKEQTLWRAAYSRENVPQLHVYWPLPLWDQGREEYWRHNRKSTRSSRKEMPLESFISGSLAERQPSCCTFLLLWWLFVYLWRQSSFSWKDVSMLMSSNKPGNPSFPPDVCLYTSLFLVSGSQPPGSEQEVLKT